MQLQRFEFFVGILSAVRRRLTFSWMAEPFSEKVCEDQVHMVFYRPSTLFRRWTIDRASLLPPHD